MCVLLMHVCMRGCTCVGAFVYGGAQECVCMWRSEVGISVRYCSPLYVLRLGLSMDPELADSAGLDSQIAQGTCCLCH